MDRPGVDPGRRDHRTMGDESALSRSPLTSDRQIGCPPGSCTINLDLVDGLGGTPVSQLRGAISGTDDHRHARVVRFDDRRKVIRRRGTRGTHQHRRPTRAAGLAERKEPC